MEEIQKVLRRSDNIGISVENDCAVINEGNPIFIKIGSPCKKKKIHCLPVKEYSWLAKRPLCLLVVTCPRLILLV